MTNAPERIWAKVHGASTDVISGQRGLLGAWHEIERDGHTAYIRADLLEAVEAENQRLREALEACIAFADGIADQCGIDMDETAFVIRVMPEGREIGHRSWSDVQTAARAALRSTEASHDD